MNRRRMITALLTTAALVGSVGAASAHEGAGAAPPASVVTEASDAGQAALAIDTALDDSAPSALPIASLGAVPESPSGVVIPGSSDGVVSTTVSSGDTIGIGLPAQSTGGAPVTVGDTAVYPAVEGGAVGVQALENGGVRILVTIASADAPRTYSFPFDLAQGSYLALQDDGTVEVVDKGGSTRGVIERPWAKDATGAAVSTTYAVEGNVLVQTVNFDSSTPFPVVADPAFQGDCGIVSCTARLDRAATRNARDASWLIGAAAAICGVASGGALAIVCAAGVAPASVVLAVAAGRYYENGNCLAIKYYVVGGAGWPSEVKKGQYNCK